MINIKHHIRDSFIRCMTVTGVTSLYRSKKRKQGPLVRVLCFHDVADKAWFEKVITLCLEDYNVLTPEQFRSQDYNEQKINILLTFDDGYQSWVDICLPILEKYHCKGLFFINSGLLDIAGDTQKVDVYMQNRLLITPKSPLTWEGAKVLSARGHSIGGHTVTHPNLAGLPESEVHAEVQNDKQRTESMLGIELNDFAYPFGTKLHYNEAVAKHVAELGYQYIYTAETGFYCNSTKSVPRTLVEQRQTMRSLRHWIEGGYDIFSTLKF